MGVDAAVVIEDLTKEYGGNVVLDHANLRIEPGRVHAFLGPNGAGKSTLLGCLSGAVQPDGGTITIGDRVYQSFTPASAFEAGTAIIYQHFQLVDDLSVADNIYLGAEIKTGPGLLDRKAQAAGTREILNRLGVDLDPNVKVGTLSVGQRQLVEIAKALRHEPSTLILDEPTSALSRTEVEALLKLVRRLASEYKLAVVYTTHLLHEVLEVADEVTVLRDGRIQWTRPAKDLSMSDLVAAISPGASQTRAAVGVRGTGEVLLSLTDYQCAFTGPVNLELRAGDILGVFGLLGSGRSNLLETICGVHRRKSGSSTLRGRGYNPGTTQAAVRRGVALVPSDRAAMSIFADMGALDNVLMGRWTRTTKARLRQPKVERQAFADIASSVQLRPPNPAQLAGRFSGGNAQKLVVGRWLNNLAPLSVLVLDEPTQGIDVGTRLELYRLLREFVSGPEPAAVIFASSDPEEVEILANRILLLADGEVLQEMAPGGGEEALLNIVHSKEMQLSARGEGRK